MLGPRVNVIVDSGPFHIRPSGIPSDHQPKGTRGDSSLVAIPASITRYALYRSQIRNTTLLYVAVSGILRHLIALRFIRPFWPFCFSLL